MDKCTVRFVLLLLAVLLVLFGCDRGGANEALECDPGPIPGQYIVVLADTVQDVSAAAHRLANEVDGEIMSVWTETLRGFAVTGITEEDAQTLRKHPFVERISPNERGCYDLAGFSPEHVLHPA